MRFVGDFKVIDFDSRKYTKTLNAAMEVHLRNAARAWLRAMLAYEIPVVRGVSNGPGSPPVWTGTARGTLTYLAKELRVDLKIKPVVRITGRGPIAGARLGKYVLEYKLGSYHFRFSTQLKYFVSNEFDESNAKLIHRTPWGGFKVGQKAFQDYAKKIVKDYKALPQPIDSIRYTTRIVR